MKKLLFFAALAITLKITGLMPFAGGDVAQLLPVRVLTVDVERGQVVLGGGDVMGRGATLDEALEDMKTGAEGTVFLATAEQVILSPRAKLLLEDVSKWEVLRPAARVLLASGELPSPDKAADYLEVHDAAVTLQQVRAALLRGEPVRLPLLHITEGGLRLETRQNG